jgi:hypothetical protein
VAKLAVNWLTVVPFTMHPVFRWFSYGDVVNYNTNARASFFFKFFLGLFSDALRTGQIALQCESVEAIQQPPQCFRACEVKQQFSALIDAMNRAPFRPY